MKKISFIIKIKLNENFIYFNQLEIPFQFCDSIYLSANVYFSSIAMDQKREKRGNNISNFAAVMLFYQSIIKKLNAIYLIHFLLVKKFIHMKGKHI